jgi:hypothetical protein
MALKQYLIESGEIISPDFFVLSISRTSDRLEFDHNLDVQNTFLIR